MAVWRAESRWSPPGASGLRAEAHPPQWEPPLAFLLQNPMLAFTPSIDVDVSLVRR